MSTDRSKEEVCAEIVAQATAQGVEIPTRTREDLRPILREIMGDEAFERVMAEEEEAARPREALASRDPGKAKT